MAHDLVTELLQYSSLACFMPIWQLCANLLIPNCLRSNLSYSPLATLELYVKVRKHEGLSSWMKRSNILVSFLCEQEITNFQALLITQLFTSLTVLMCSNFLNTLTLFICVIWFVCSFMLCKKYISLKN